MGRVNTTRSSVGGAKAIREMNKGATALAISNFFEMGKPSEQGFFHLPLSANAHHLGGHMNTKIVGLGGGFTGFGQSRVRPKRNRGLSSKSQTNLKRR